MLRRIGQYEIRGELGKGGFGRVYLAFDPRVGRPVAVKVLETGDDPNVISRFRTEAIAAGNLRHRNIVTVFEFGEDQGKQFLVMEYLDGQDLHAVITSHRPLTLLDKVDIMSQVGDGLQYSHQNGVVHRDVKPANIMLLSEGLVKIMDFGIARLVRENAKRLTQSGYLVGTVAYMAPEQFAGAEVDALGDIWAYGVIYYELLTGQHPFQAGESADAAATMFRITNQPPPPVRSLNPECPELLENVISRLLSKDRDKRYQSFEDVQFDVAPILTGLQKKHAVELVARVRELLAQRKVEEANVAVRQILELDPANPEGRELRSRVQEEKKKWPRVEALLKTADTAAAGRNFPEAIAALESAAKMAPADPSIQLRQERIRGAMQQAERAGKLIEQAQKQLDAGNPTGAFKDLSQALQADPLNADAQRLLDRSKRDMEARERERRLHDGLGRARGLLMINAFDEADQLLRELEAGNENSPQVASMRGEFLRQKQEVEARDRLQTRLAQCKELLKHGDLSHALQTLEELAKEFPADRQVASLLSYAKGEQESRERQRRVEELGREAWTLTRSSEFDRALQVVETGLQQFPGEEKLVRLMQTILAGKAEFEAARFFQNEIERGDQTRKAGRLEEAAAIAESLSAEHGARPELTALRDRIRHDIEVRDAEARERQRQEIERQKQEAERQRQEAERQRQEAERQKLEAERRQQEALKQKDIQEFLERAGERERAGDLDGALSILDQGLKKHGVVWQLADAFGKIQGEKNVADDARRIRERIAAQDWAAALAQIESAQRKHGGHPVFSSLLEQTQTERQAAVATACADAERLLARFDFTRARDRIAQARKAHGDDPRLADLERQAQAAEFRRGRIVSAHELLRQRDWPRAEAAVREVLAQDAGDSEARELLAEIGSQREQALRRQRYDQGRAETARLIAAENFDGAIAALETLLEQHPGDRVLEDDLAAARAAKAGRVRQARQQLYDRGRMNAERLAREQNFDGAMEALRNLLAEFPNDNVLMADLKDVAARRAAREREEGRAEAARLIGEGNLDAAVGVLERLLGQIPGDALLAADLRQAQAARDEQRLRQIKQHGRDDADRLLREHQFDAAIQAIERLLAQFPGDPVLEEDLRSARTARERHEQRRAYEEGRAEAERLMKIRNFEAASSRLRLLLEQFPSDPLFEQMLEASSKARDTHQRNSRIDVGRIEAQRLAKERNFDAAIRGLESLLQEFPGDSGLEEELRAVTSAKALADQRKKDDELVALLEKLYTRTDTHRARELATKRLAEGEEPRVREWLERTERLSETLETPVPEPRRGKTWPVAVGLTAVLGALAFLVWKTAYPAPKIAINPEHIEFVVRAGQGSPKPQPVLVTATSRWQVQASDDWIAAAQRDSGKQLVVSVRPEGLPAGQYSGWLRVNLEDGQGSKELPVKLTVEGLSGSLSLNPENLSFTSTSENPQPQPQSVTVNASGKWKPGSSREKWISASEQGGKLLVRVNPGGLESGAYSGVVDVSTENGDAHAPLIVNLVVGKPKSPPPAVIPNELRFTYTTGQAQPSPQTASVEPAAGWRFTSNDSWISATQLGDRLQVAVNPAGRKPGISTGSIGIANGSGSAVLRVTLSVGEPARSTITIDPAAVTFPPYTKGSPAPSQPLIIGGGPWRATAGADWITLSPSAGDASTRLQVSVHPGRLGLGPHAGSVTVSSADGRATKAIPVSITVQNRPLPDPVDCHAATYLGVQGGNITWSGELSPGATVTLWPKGVYEGGGSAKGPALPGCDVTARVVSPNGVTIDEPPSQANRFALLKLRNATGVTVSSILVRWDLK